MLNLEWVKMIRRILIIACLTNHSCKVIQIFLELSHCLKTFYSIKKRRHFRSSLLKRQCRKNISHTVTCTHNQIQILYVSAKNWEIKCGDLHSYPSDIARARSTGEMSGLCWCCALCDVCVIFALQKILVPNAPYIDAVWQITNFKWFTSLWPSWPWTFLIC